MFDQVSSMMRVAGSLTAVAICSLSFTACSSARLSEPSYLGPSAEMQRRSLPSARTNYDRRRSARIEPQSRHSFGRAIRVARGDTLYYLARRHGVSVNALMAENSLTSTKLTVGQTLYLPYAR